MKYILPLVVINFLFFIHLQAQNEFDAKKYENLSKDELEAFTQLTTEKVSEFETYLATIGSRESTKTDKDLATKQALKLFTPEAMIEVSYQQNGEATRVVNRQMKEYLRRLKVLPFARIEITFYQVAYVSGFLKGKDGKYYAAATIFQKFKAWNAEGQLVVNDIDKKTINIRLEYNYNEYYDEWNWTVLLDDVKVTDVSRG